MAETNPFTLAHQAIWTCLEASAEFTAAVRTKVKFTESDRDPWTRLANVQTFPAVAVLPAGGMTRLEADSDQTFVEKEFHIVEASGDQRIDELFDVELAVLRAMAAWRTYVSVTWNSKACILDCTIRTRSEELDRELVNRGIRGWSGICTGKLLFHFTTTDLQE